MGLQFCQQETPNIDERAFQLLNLFGAKISIADYTALEDETTAALALARAGVDAIKVEIDALNKQMIKLQHQYSEL